LKKGVLIIAAAMILALINFPTAGAVSSIHRIYEDFESSNISGRFTKVNADCTWTNMHTAGMSDGALEVNVLSKMGSPQFSFEMIKGATYNVSAWIKMKQTPLTDTVNFVFQSKNFAGTETYYTTISAKTASLQAGKWAYVSKSFVFDGKGTKIGTGGLRYDVVPASTLDIRIGSGDAAVVMSAGQNIEYFLDDLIVMPTVSNAVNLIQKGSFDTADYKDVWQDMSAVSSYASGGANSTAGCVYIDSTGNYGTIKQNVPIKYNTNYKISFWAKTDSDAYSGKNIQLIVDRKAVKTDANVTNYQYLKDSLQPVITKNWVKYEISYNYTISTTDVSVPSLYFRVGTGLELEKYYIDEFVIEEQSDITPAIQMNLSGAYKVGEQLSLNCVYTPAVNKAGYWYRIMRSFGTGGWITIENGTTNADLITYNLQQADADKQLKFEVTTVDLYGDYGISAEKNTSVIYADNVVNAYFVPNVWDEALGALDAGVEFKNNADPVNILSALAMYTPDNILAGVSYARDSVSSGQSINRSIALNNTAAASHAKLFVWEESTMTPIMKSLDIEKSNNEKFIYVDAEYGADTNSGSFASPLKTVNAAKTAAQLIKTQTSKNIYVMFKPGVYPISQTVAFTAQDGSETQKIVYTSYGKEKAVFSGGKEVKNWSLHNADKNIYKTYVGTSVNSRQLYINGVRAVRARSTTGLSNCTTDKTVGHTTTDTFLANFAHVSDLEMVYYEQWTNPRCGVSSINIVGDVATVAMKQPGWSYVENKGGTAATKPVYYENAYELLDEAGEWYLDRYSGYLYYIPRFFEDINTAEVILPTTEKMITISGSVDAPAKNIEFHNIDFKYTTWMRPSGNDGHSDAQNNHIRQQGADKLPDGAIEVTDSRNIVFENCGFSKLGITALKMTGAIQDCNVNANEFYDISGSAVSLGEPNTSNQNIVNPTLEKYMIKNNNITNNYIHRIGVDYMSAAAISAGFPKNTNISHNEIFDTPYSGMHIGYGWDTLTTSAIENLKIENNYIHTVMNYKIFDGGGIYTIGATGGTMENPNLIKGNYVKDVKNFHGALYTDEGSTFWKLCDNVVDLSSTPTWFGNGVTTAARPSRWLHVWTDSIKNMQFVGNYSTTAEKTYKAVDSIFEEPYLYPEANWPQAAQDIINNAGIQTEYQSNFEDGLQEVYMGRRYNVTVGNGFVLDLAAKTRKDKLYDFKNSSVYYKNYNPDIISLDGDFNVRALKSGNALVEVCIVEQGILNSFKIEIYVE